MGVVCCVCGGRASGAPSSHWPWRRLAETYRGGALLLFDDLARLLHLLLFGEVSVDVAVPLLQDAVVARRHVGHLHDEYAEGSIKYGILFVFSLIYEYSNLEYGHVPVEYRVHQAEYVNHFLVAAPQEYVNVDSTRRVGHLVRRDGAEAGGGLLDGGGGLLRVDGGPNRERNVNVVEVGRELGRHAIEDAPARANEKSRELYIYIYIYLFIYIYTYI